jgi:hypothetical protein
MVDHTAEMQHAAKISIAKATYCGVEINRDCSNYLVKLGAQEGTGTDASTNSQPQVSYLNVHSGVSMGLMAGIDVGSDDRWEYLLIGEPLADVASAESEAGQGELVISPAAHAMLHPKPKQVKETTGMYYSLVVRYRGIH